MKSCKTTPASMRLQDRIAQRRPSPQQSGLAGHGERLHGALGQDLRAGLE